MSVGTSYGFPGNPNMPTRDAVVLWRKAMRRADKETKKLLLSMVRQFRKRKPTHREKTRCEGFTFRCRSISPLPRHTVDPKRSVAERAICREHQNA
jgi:hypothetical protein